MTTKAGTRADIQALRAIAVGLVVVAHAGIDRFAGGFVGVDVFFVVSGFLITGLLLREAERSGRVSITHFYARRARRIIPAATVVLAATVLWAAWRLPASRAHEIAGDAGWSAAFLANIHVAAEGTDYFAGGGAQSPLQHFWSLAVEEQFYVVWPLLVLAVTLGVAARSRRVALAGLATLVFVGSLVWSVSLTASAPTAAYFSPFTRAHELAAGALLAIVVPALGRLPQWARPLLALGGLLAIAASAVTYTEATPFPGNAALLPVLGTVAVLAAGTGRNGSAASLGVLGRLAAWAPVQWLGDRSYSLYLWHWPVLILGELQFGRSIPKMLAFGVVMLALTEVSYRWIETPFRAPHRLRARRALVLWPTAVATVAVTCLAGTSWADAALAERQADAAAYWNDRQVQTSPVARASDLMRDAAKVSREGAPVPPALSNLDGLQTDNWSRAYPCSANWEVSELQVCPIGDTSAIRTMVVFGDSHAGQWLPALDQVGRDTGWKVIPLIKLGCGPYDVPQLHWGAPFPSCPVWRERALAEVEQIHPALLVLAARGAMEVDAPQPALAWREGMERTIAAVRPMTDRAVVLSATPVINVDAAECLTGLDADLGRCSTSPQGPELASNADTAAAAKAGGAEFVDVVDLVCAEHRCPFVADGMVVWRDPWHISASWSRRTAPEIAQLLGLTAP